jgi:LysM repeat protein
MANRMLSMAAALATLALIAGAAGCAPQDEEDGVHVVQEGETIFSIAQERGVSVDALLEANPDAEPDDLRVGQRLQIPDAEPDAVTADDRLDAVTRVEGRMTDEGVTCPAMRGDDGTLYTLIGHDDLDNLQPGERIYVEGTEPEVSICMQGITLEVTHLERR